MSNKYFAKKVTYKNIQFDSKKEYERYVYLEMLMKNKEISELEVHPVYPLMVNGTKIGRYTADFTYKDKTGNVVVEDVKSKYTKTRDIILFMLTQLGNIKRAGVMGKLAMIPCQMMKFAT